MYEPNPGVYILDFGRNFAGWIELTVDSGFKGQKIEVRYGELLTPFGNVNVLTSTAGQIKGPECGGPCAPPLAYQGDIFILNGPEKHVFRSYFSWHGFRYAEIRNYPRKITLNDAVAMRVRSAVPHIGSFLSSNQLFNDIYTMAGNSLESNMMSVQSDCPHRFQLL
eukprot:TRINITY_DN10519_c0_g1_i1.p1 TRINITY_DN10519_c0_g1~~TRINITY_DN10519_c0_g1_i1.p1  ORF type:complete len:166 (+),score=26.82 TRINITY_DN10519_c0_g1_i1:420-917(+)